MHSAVLALILLLVSAAGCVMARDGHVKPLLNGRYTPAPTNK
jgi:hypothetical protein